MYSEAELRELFATSCGASIDECLDDVTLFTLGIDSLALASLIVLCETRLQVDLDDESVQGIMTAQNVGDVVSQLQSAQLRSGTRG